MAKILCADGVEREDTPEQAEVRATHKAASRFPEKFWWYGVPYSTNTRKGTPNSLSAQVKAALLDAARIIGQQTINELQRKAANTKDKEPRLIAEQTLGVIEAIAKASSTDEMLVAYFLELHAQKPNVLGTIMGRLLPTQISGVDGGPIKLEVESKQELIDTYNRLGIPLPAWVTAKQVEAVVEPAVKNDE
jgi:hypothetical protein